MSVSCDAAAPVSRVRRLPQNTHDIMAPSAAKKPRTEEHPAVTLFREYLRIKSVQPDPDYDSCVAFLKRMADELELPYRVVEMVKGKPILLSSSCAGLGFSLCRISAHLEYSNTSSMT